MADKTITPSTTEKAGKISLLGAIFIGIGFETTAPTVAAAILQAEEEKLKTTIFYPSTSCARR
jgi:hydrogenase maturation factor